MKIQYLLLLGIFFLISCGTQQSYEITGELKQWHKITFTFDGPFLSENSEENPFLDYRLEMTFKKEGKTYKVPGYFAADGNAANTSATEGNKWRVHFAPDEVGTWTFSTSFKKGKNIAIAAEENLGEAVSFDGENGIVEVLDSDKKGRDFRSQGKIQISENGRHFQYKGSNNYFLKAGADSPENLLAYHEFDSTYRHPGEARKGESDPTESLHHYPTHLQDWKIGDPTWQNEKGKAIIGALNYLSDQGMNAVYFLVFNINGDGKDVWPYTNHKERFRFDCSKLDQWEIVFEQMEKLGLMMHIVTQETENELLLDNGNTAQERKIFYRELIARFAHHNALVWNLGEENGPAEFSPNGQNTEQRKAMASYLKTHDPYQHPVVLHTHSWEGHKDEILTDLLGFEALDGLSFQVDKRTKVHKEILKWDSLSLASGHPWLIAMDEIGMWHTGVMDDATNPKHDTIRQEVLWGTLMAGAAGLEWYFGAYYPHNDLTMEDWRSRENMWQQTRHATHFFETYLEYWEMKSRDDLTNIENAYCLAKANEKYAIYFPIGTKKERLFDLKNQENKYKIRWYNPRSGGELVEGTVKEIAGKGWQNIGMPMLEAEMDWLAFLEVIED